jgi:hypothetical protein
MITPRRKPYFSSKTLIGIFRDLVSNVNSDECTQHDSKN